MNTTSSFLSQKNRSLNPSSTLEKGELWEWAYERKKQTLEKLIQPAEKPAFHRTLPLPAFLKNIFVPREREGDFSSSIMKEGKNRLLSRTS